MGIGRSNDVFQAALVSPAALLRLVLPLRHRHWIELNLPFVGAEIELQLPDPLHDQEGSGNLDPFRQGLCIRWFESDKPGQSSRSAAEVSASPLSCLVNGAGKSPFGPRFPSC